MNTVEKRKIFTCQDSNPRRSADSPSLSYPSSSIYIYYYCLTSDKEESVNLVRCYIRQSSVDSAHCCLCKVWTELYWYFAWMYCFHLQGWRVSQATNIQEEPCLLCLFFGEGGLHWHWRCQDSIVGIATVLWVRRPSSRSSSPGRVKNFLFSKSSRPALEPTQPPIQWVPGALSPGCEADHSPPASVEVKKMWIYTSTPPYTFMV
jgi:hypothetical protein